MSQRFQVVIVGGGPVGMALGVELGRRGVQTAVVERHRTPQRIPKGQSLTQRTLEHFYFWGIEPQLRAARVLPPGYPIGSLTAYGNLMSDYWFGPDTRERVLPYYFQKNERLPQYLTEEVLRTRAQDFPNVGCIFGQTARSIEQDDTTVRVTVTDETWPYEEQVIEADYVVGCDGARSIVREQLGIDRGGADFDQRMVLAVFRSRELHEGLARFPECTTYRVLHPDLQGYWQFFGRVDVGEGWFFHAPVPRDTTPDSYDFLGLIQRAAGFACAAQFDHVGFWDLRIAVATRYQVGRVFIAGDACHSHPPYGGFGLNSGLEDAVNLGWKLSAALSGWGGEALLASYGEERRPIFVETGEAMIAGGIEADRAFLDRYRPERDQAEFEQAWTDLGKRAGSRRQSYEPHYEGSRIVFGPAAGVCSIHGAYSFAAQPGHHLSPVELSSGKNVFEELGDEFTLLALGASDNDVALFEDNARQIGVPLSVTRDAYNAAYGARLVLVRPDQYVAWVADEAPDEPRHILERAIGR